MIFNQAALKRQATVLALLVIIVIAGVYCYRSLPRRVGGDCVGDHLIVKGHTEVEDGMKVTSK